MCFYCILNSDISKIDFNKNVIVKYADGRYKCRCFNTDTQKGFTDLGDDLLLCNFCGRIFNSKTLEIIREARLS